MEKISINRRRGKYIRETVRKIIKSIFLDSRRGKDREILYQAWDRSKGDLKSKIKSEIEEIIRERSYDDRFWIALSREVIDEKGGIDLENKVLEYIVREVYEGEVRDVLIKLKSARELYKRLYERRGRCID